MESTDVNCLIEMGFPKEKADKALSVTSGQGLQAAIDWLFAHNDDSSGQTLGGSENKTTETPAKDSSNGSHDESSPAGTEVACLICDDCGKKFRTENDAQFHAVKSKHQNFSESTDIIAPLTEEEKQEQAAKLQEKLVARRKQREEEEKQQQLEREKTRRKTGKELTQIKQKHQVEEMKKLADQRRKEKLEEKALRQRLKLQIAEDRANHKAAQQAAAGNQPAATQPVATSPPAQSTAPKDYSECRVQFRLTNGACLTTKFKPNDRFALLSEYVTENRTDGDSPFTLMTTFPRKEFTDEHTEMTLQELGLVPSSVIVVRKV